jgi:hypothetical protein
VILENLSTHDTAAIRAFLAAYPQVHLHLTPTYASWLNQVKLWLSRIERDRLARDIFMSVANLAQQIRRYIRHYDDVAKPVRWSYADQTRRVTGSISAPHRPLADKIVIGGEFLAARLSTRRSSVSAPASTRTIYAQTLSARSRLARSLRYTTTLSECVRIRATRRSECISASGILESLVKFLASNKNYRAREATPLGPTTIDNVAPC